MDVVSFTMARTFWIMSTMHHRFQFRYFWHFNTDAACKIDDVLPEHGGLLHVIPLAVKLRFFCWTSRGDVSELFLLFEVYCGTPHSCLKVIGGVGMG